MAYLHSHRSETVDSLYRGRTPSDQGVSDKENRGPEPQMSSMEPPRTTLPSHLNKRRRLDRSQTPRTQFLSQHPIQDDDDSDKQYYDPDQDQEYRRGLRLEMYRHRMEFQANREEILSGDTEHTLNFIQHQNHLMDRVRQTSDATIDARIMLDVTGTVNKRLANSAFRNSATTVDVKKFVSKCIRFMNQEQTAPRASEDSDVEDDGLELDWNRLGDLAVVCNRRPAVPSFLLGPLSIEKRTRTTQRSARQRRQPPTVISRPEELDLEDLEKNENSNLTQLCDRIRDRLRQIIHKGAEGVEAGMLEDMENDEVIDLFRKFHLSTNYEVSLFEFAVNPRSFAQTVENLFYISFLIRDGYVRLSTDNDGLPTLRNEDPPPNNEQAKQKNVSRHQKILSLDYGTWQKLSKGLGITEPLIPHRINAETQISSSGWYG